MTSFKWMFTLFYVHTDLIITIFFIFIAVPASYCVDYVQFSECKNLFDCGKLQDIGYPFWVQGLRPQFCGHQWFELLECEDDEYPLLPVDNQIFRLLHVNESSQMITVKRTNFLESGCPENPIYNNSTVNETVFGPNFGNLSIFYGCPFEVSNLHDPYNFSCIINGKKSGAFYSDKTISLDKQTACSITVEAPVPREGLKKLSNGNATLLGSVLNREFDMKYNAQSSLCTACNLSGGICGSSSSSPPQFACLCHDQPYQQVCQDHEGEGILLWFKLLIGIGGAIVGILLIWISCCFRRKVSSNSMVFWRGRTKNDQTIEVFIRNYESLAPKRYTYSEVKKITSSFKDKLGQGGYGNVYKGKLINGCPVAVKVLKASKGNGEEFINEVASISRTSHVNVVTLLGFCIEGHKRALIYEFMPNGSLEKFIYNENPLKIGRQLGWEKLQQIAIGIAQGLEYLHRGCNTRILHFDIKPHNILLDEAFRPKISDFGLAKLCLEKESIISMLEARGTIGYIAPEVFNRNFGGVSHKSDVYSYGMMVLEMVGGRKNVDVGVAGVGHTSEIYFPHWVYKHLELDNNLRILQGDMSKEDNMIARKMVIVGLWCIQIDPSHRPSMSEVMNMLEGSIDDLQIPPKPFLSSPPRSPANPSTFSTVSIS